MGQLLEDKVSNLMASVKDLKAEIESLKTEVGEHITENKSLT